MFKDKEKQLNFRICKLRERLGRFGMTEMDSFTEKDKVSSRENNFDCYRVVTELNENTLVFETYFRELTLLKFICNFLFPMFFINMILLFFTSSVILSAGLYVLIISLWLPVWAVGFILDGFLQTEKRVVFDWTKLCIYVVNTNFIIRFFKLKTKLNYSSELEVYHFSDISNIFTEVRTNRPRYFITKRYNTNCNLVVNIHGKRLNVCKIRSEIMQSEFKTFISEIVKITHNAVAV